MASVKKMLANGTIETREPYWREKGKVYDGVNGDIGDTLSLIHILNNGTLVDTMVNDALTDAFNHYHMMITAENVAEPVSYTHLDVYKRQDLRHLFQKKRSSL